MLGRVDAIYDRAALVALPPTMRSRYTAHLNDITEHASQFLITFEYDQKKMEGPPFSITEDEVKKHYEKSHKPVLVERAGLKNGLKGNQAKEAAWVLNKISCV